MLRSGIALLVLCTMVLTGCGGGGGTPVVADTQNPEFAALTGIEHDAVLTQAPHITAQATDNVGVTRLRLKINTVEVALVNGGVLDFDWEIQYFKPGIYSLLWIAEDAAGNRVSKAIAVRLNHDYNPNIEQPDDNNVIIVDPQEPAPEPEPEPEPEPQPEPEPEPEPQPTPTPAPPPEPVPIPVPPNNNIIRPPGAPATQLTPVELINGEEVVGLELPPFNEDEYIPDDKALPKMYLTGVVNEAIVFGTVNIAAFCSDNTKVNAMALWIDGEQVASSALPAIDYVWDTTTVEDGWHQLSYFARDNGKLLVRARIQVKVCNHGDRYAPVLKITKPTKQYCPAYDFSTLMCIGLQGQIQASATDDSPVLGMKLYYRNGDEEDYEWVQIVNTPTASFIANYEVLPLDPEEINAIFYEDYDVKPGLRLMKFRVAAWDSNLFLAAEDISVYNCVAGFVLGNPLAPNGRILRDVKATCNTADERAANDPFPVHLFIRANQKIAFGQPWAIPFGKRVANFKRDDFTHQVTLDLSPGEVCDLTQRYIRFTPQYGPAHSTRQVGLVSGSRDHLGDHLDALMGHPGSMLGQAGLTMDDVVWIDGDDSLADDAAPNFMDVITDPAQLYNYRILVILSGNAYEDDFIADPAAQALLQGWVKDGGVLVCTEQAYDFSEQIFPSELAFTMHANEPEEHNAAQDRPAAKVINARFYKSYETYWEDYYTYLNAMLPDFSYHEDQYQITTNWPSGWISLMSQNGDAPPVLWCIDEDTNSPVVVSYEMGLGRVLIFAGPVKPQTQQTQLGPMDFLLDYIVFREFSY